MLKKDFTSFDLHAIVKELKEKIIDSRINNVYQLDAKTLLLRLHKTNQPTMQIVLEAGRRLHLTNYSTEKPKTPPAFCIALRKYLLGEWISNVEQYEFERIAKLQVKTKTGNMQLILELFGEGNIILTGEKNEILQALFFKRMRDRNIIRNEIYQFPPPLGKNPFKVNREELTSGLKSAGDTQIVKALVRFLGLGGTYSEEVLLRAKVEKTKPSADLTSLEIDAVFNSLQELLSSVTGKRLEPCIVLDENSGFTDVIPFRLKRYENFKLQSFSNFSDALDEFYMRATAVEKATAGIDVEQFKREDERLKRMIVEQEKALQEGERGMAYNKCIGDAIYARFNELQALLEKFSSTWREGKNLATVASEVASAKKSGRTPETYFESFDSRNLAIKIHTDDLSFSLNIRKSLYENAAEYYDLSKMTKQKMAGISTALEDSRKKLVEIEMRLSEVEALKAAAPAEAVEVLATRKVKNKEWFEKFRWFISSESFLVVAGKDVVSNEVLLKKYTEPHDVVFHADIVGSPFTVVKTDGKQPGEQTLREASEFAAAFSRAWRENMGAVDVYYVKPEQLSKSGPSGEFVPHGAFAVTGKRNWSRGTPLRLAVGTTEGNGLVYNGGPLDAVKAKSKVYVILVPGDLTGKDLLKQIIRSLVLQSPKENREKISKTSIESIRELVPYAKARIIIPT